MIWLAVAITSFAAGVVQTVTGFGAGVLIIMTLTQFYNMLIAPAINTSICLIITAYLAWKNRKQIDLRLIRLPIVAYSITSASVILVAEFFDINLLAVSFGIFLIGLSAYFLFFADRIRLQASIRTALICSIISGLFSGLFGVGGPVLGLYLITVTDSHERYIGNIQFLFLVTNISNLTVRVLRGIYSMEFLPVTIIGIISILAGARIGFWICRKLNIELLKKIVYVFVGISGIVTIFQHILILE